MSENKKPRIAEILGVEVGERFSLMGFQPHYVEFWIKSDGTFETKPPRVPNSTVALLRAIEQPCFVIRKPRWTEQEAELAKALKRMIKNAHHARRCVEEVSLRLYGKYDDYILTLNNCFAALPPQTEVTLDEIIGGAE